VGDIRGKNTTEKAVVDDDDDEEDWVFDSQDAGAGT
jgi:hypothetical protein